MDKSDLKNLGDEESQLPNGAFDKLIIGLCAVEFFSLAVQAQRR
jgi:hypothetical protein